MILPIAFLLGAVFGWFRAAKRGGNRLDKFQFAAAHGIAALLLALVVVMALDWAELV